MSLNDIYSMLLFDLKGFADVKINFDYITVRTAKISPGARTLWNSCVAVRTKKLKVINHK